jgi:tRNA dimethylallyltransferase
VLVVAGPTASGKSALALALAEDLGGIVINADALQCYRDLRLLTARPDAAAEARTPHRLYGFLDAAERGSAGRWCQLALAEIGAAYAAGHLPIIVGGSGLYLRALMHGLAPIPDIPDRIREEGRALHRALGGAGFRERLAGLDEAAAARLAAGDTTRLLRAYEVVRATGRPIGSWQAKPHRPPPGRYCTILLQPPRPALYAACDARFAAMLAAGALDEAAALAERRLDPGLPVMQAAGLPELFAYLRGEMPRDAAVAAAQRATRRYAKRQITWFRHQAHPDLILNEQFSERILPIVRHFIDAILLTGAP